MYTVREDGKSILEFHDDLEFEARATLIMLHAFDRRGCSLWRNGKLVVGELITVEDPHAVTDTTRVYRDRSGVSVL